MKAINSKFVLVKKFEEEKKDGFQTVDVTDNFVYKGVVHEKPAHPVWVDDHQVGVGDVIMFAKYSPDTHEIDYQGVKMKMVKAEDILSVL